MPPKTKVVEKKKTKSGFCGIGSCEGTKPKSASGTPMRTCDFIETCSCDCHKLITKMFEIAEQPRQVMDNPEYKPFKSPYWMPSLEDIARERAALSNGDDTDAHHDIKRPASDAIPPLVTHSFTPTPSGRAARGELETWVNDACGEWLVEKYSWDCTPLFISEKIAKREGIQAPSTGAITACLTRWKELGYAQIGKKPIRFINFTPEGVKLGLDVMKEQAKRNRKQRKDMMARGMR